MWCELINVSVEEKQVLRPSGQAPSKRGLWRLGPGAPGALPAPAALFFSEKFTRPGEQSKLFTYVPLKM